MEKLYYTIGEVAEIIGESVSLVRFWSNRFSRFIKPQRTAKGNRLFTAADVETFKQIHSLVKDKGLTLDGAAAKLSADRASVAGNVRVLDSLKSIKEQLFEIRKSL